MTGIESLSPAPSASLARPERPRVVLPAYRLRLSSHGSRNIEGQWTWHGSSWREDRNELLGGERSVWTWLHAICGKPQDQATRWNQLYWRIRDASGWPVVVDRVPANFLHDVREHAEFFERLAAASWCLACHAAPQIDELPLCAWCLRAPIADLYVRRGRAA